MNKKALFNDWSMEVLLWVILFAILFFYLTYRLLGGLLD
jgi:hypothetical protein